MVLNWCSKDLPRSSHRGNTSSSFCISWNASILNCWCPSAGISYLHSLTHGKLLLAFSFHNSDATIISASLRCSIAHTSLVSFIAPLLILFIGPCPDTLTISEISNKVLPDVFFETSSSKDATLSRGRRKQLLKSIW